jgi:hypothetical protein
MGLRVVGQQFLGNAQRVFVLKDEGVPAKVIPVI